MSMVSLYVCFFMCQVPEGTTSDDDNTLESVPRSILRRMLIVLQYMAPEDLTAYWRHCSDYFDLLIHIAQLGEV